MEKNLFFNLHKDEDINGNDYSTGTDILQNTKFGVYFLDNTCPLCTNKMEVIERKIKDKNIKLFYHCYNCGFISPIQNEIDVDNIIPNYVYKFRTTYGRMNNNSFWNRINVTNIKNNGLLEEDDDDDEYDYV